MDTLTAVLITSVVTGGVVASIYRLATAIERFAPVRQAEEAQELVLPLVPDDLMALAMQEKEVWAQEEVMRVIRERYELYNDWNNVRAAMGVGRRDDA